jgi:hypothetical protein
LQVRSYLALVIAISSVAFADDANVDSSAIINQYVAVSKAQESRLQDASMEVDIEADVPTLHKHGRLRALRRISSFGRRITYDALHFEGDHSVRNDVIARYLTAESEALKSEPATFAVTPANYRFKYAGLVAIDGRKVYAFHVSPRKKKVGLFVGELWLDPETHLVVRESGRLVKSPSIFVRKIEFVRDFGVEGGVSIPTRTQYSVDTRLVGRANLSIAFTPIRTGDSL